MLKPSYLLHIDTYDLFVVGPNDLNKSMATGTKYRYVQTASNNCLAHSNTFIIAMIH